MKVDVMTLSKKDIATVVRVLDYMRTERVIKSANVWLGDLLYEVTVYATGEIDRGEV